MAQVSTGDITLKFKDSCNWCCCARKVDDHDYVYITRKGDVAILDPSKTSLDVAGEKSVENVEEIIRKVAEQRRLDTLEYIERFRELTNITFISRKDPLTWERVKQINRDIQGLFVLPSP